VTGKLGLLEVLPAVLALEPHHRRASPEASGGRSTSSRMKGGLGRVLARVLTGRRRGEEQAGAALESEWKEGGGTSGKTGPNKGGRQPIILSFYMGPIWPDQ
jgi:hypothetical protein